MNAGPEIEKGLEDGELNVLRRLGERALEENTRIFVVGGAVRDLLLKGSCADLDVVVEGDAVEFGRSAARELGAGFTAHGVFGTATIELPDGMKIDLATARSETYSSPGALPDVNPDTIEKDLYRRDFTINAMAASLTPDDFGEIYDPFNGRKDIDSGVLKILHEKSFIDDPTRILRGIRFAARFGFSFDEETKNHIVSAMESSVMDTVSGARIKNEIEYCFSEEKRGDVVSLLNKFTIPDALAQGLVFDESAFIPEDRPAETMKVFKDELECDGQDELRPWLLGLAVAVRGNESRVIESIVERLQCDKKESGVLLKMSNQEFSSVSENLESDGILPSGVANVLEKLPKCVVMAYHAAGSEAVERNVERFLCETRHICLYINGDDLEEMGLSPSPETGAILKDLLRKKQNGVILTRQDELEIAGRIIRGEAGSDGIGERN